MTLAVFLFFLLSVFFLCMTFVLPFGTPVGYAGSALPSLRGRLDGDCYFTFVVFGEFRVELR